MSKHCKCGVLIPRPAHWTCRTHGKFDAFVAVGCPECVRELRIEAEQYKNERNRARLEAHREFAFALNLAQARKALEWYGDRTRYEHGVYTDRCGKHMVGREIIYDCGALAREALKGGGE